MIFMMFGSIVTLDGGYIPYIPFIYPVMYNPWFIYKPNKQPGFVFFFSCSLFSPTDNQADYYADQLGSGGASSTIDLQRLEANGKMALPPSEAHVYNPWQ